MHRLLEIVVLIGTTTTVASASSPITAATFAPDGQYVVLGSQSGIEVRSWPELAIVSTLPTDLANVHDLRFSPDGKSLLAAGGSPAEEGTVEVWAWRDRKRLQSVSSHDDLVYRVAWTTDGTHWATASGDGVCQVFAAGSDKPLIRYEGHSKAVLSIGFLGDGKTIASAGVDQTIRLWESASGSHLRTLDNHVGTVNGIAVRPAKQGGSPIAMATISEDRTVRLWQPAIGRLVRFTRLSSTPRTLAWLATGDRLLVGCDDGHLRILDADSLDVVSDSAGLVGRIHELIIDPLRSRVLVAGEKGIRSVPLSAGCPSP